MKDIRDMFADPAKPALVPPLPHRDFLAALMAYCYRTRASVTSYGRTEAHNAAVGGVPTSYHLVWLAADVVYDAPLELSLRHRTAAQVGLWLIAEDDHDHLQVIKPRQAASLPAPVPTPRPASPTSSGLVGPFPGSPLTMPWYRIVPGLWLWMKARKDLGGCDGASVEAT